MPQTPEQATPRGNEVKGSGARGAVWTIAQQLAGSVLRLGGNLVLTRLLFPAAFGQVMLVQTLLFAVQMLTDVGLRDSVIRHERGDDPDFLDTVWTLKVVRGVFVSIAVAVLAIPYAHFYAEPDLAPLIWALAVSCFIDSFGSTKLLSLARHLDLGRLVRFEIVMQALNLAIVILLAWQVRSAWALVMGNVIGTSLHTLASFVLFPGRNNRFRMDRKARDDVSSYGRWIVVSSAMTFASSSADTLVFGKYGGVGAIGVYAVASNLASFPANVLSSLAERVVFPLYSRYRDEGRDLNQMFDGASRPLLILGGWGIASVVAVAEPLIHVLYDSRYSAAGSMLRVLAFSAWFELLSGNIASVFKALGSPRTVAIATAVRVAVLVLLLAPVTKYAGMTAGIAVLVGSSALRWIVSVAFLRTGAAGHMRFCIIATLWVVGSAWCAIEVSNSLHAGPVVTGIVALVATAALWVWPAIKLGGLLAMARARLAKPTPA